MAVADHCHARRPALISHWYGIYYRRSLDNIDGGSPGVTYCDVMQCWHGVLYLELTVMHLAGWHARHCTTVEGSAYRLFTLFTAFNS